MRTAPAIDLVIDQLCLRCGLCCNGVLFKDVELQPDDSPERLRSLGMTLAAKRKRPALRANITGAAIATRPSVRVSPSAAPTGLFKFPQPCEALGPDCRCRIYADRPQRCRDFECALFKDVAAGRLEATRALRVIRSTLRQADRVKELLRQLGDAEEALALSLRFQRMQRDIHDKLADDTLAGVYAELTLAVHDLNMSLRREFYPAPGD